MRKILFVFLLIILFPLSANTEIKSIDGVVSLASGNRTEHVHWTASELGKNVTNPPIVNHYGITKALEFTVDTDKASYKFLVPYDYVSGDFLIHVNWTRSTTGSDESGKTVKWRIDNLVINETSENCNAGQITNDAIQDVYNSASTTDQIVYKSDPITIAAAEFSAEELIILEISAVTVDSGTPLSEPALVSLGFDYTRYKVKQ